MSMEHQRKMTCPKCGKEGEFTVWQSINTVMNPDMKNKVRDRSAFAFTCTHCHKTFDVNYGFLYHQMEDRIMIHYCQDEEAFNDAIKFYEETEASSDPLFNTLVNAGYIHRIVTDRNDLLEKLKIFDAGYDDRIIELVKAIYHVQLMQNPDAQDLSHILVDQQKDGMILVLFKNDGHILGTMPLDPELLQQITDEFSRTLPPIREDKNKVVDFHWAIQQFGKRES